MKKKIAILLIAIMAIFSGCGGNSNQATTGSIFGGTQDGKSDTGEYGLDQLDMPKEGEEIAVITTSMGVIKVRFFENVAPKAVENFLTHAKDGYYDGVIFHRVINDFMIQGGDPTGTGRGGESIWGKDFENEFGLYYHNIRGALSMANTGVDYSNSSQFFIVQADTVDESLLQQMEELNNTEGAEGGYPSEIIEAYKNKGGTPWLDYQHTVFGQVFEGMDVVDAIALVATNEEKKPNEDVIINNIKVEAYSK